MRADSSEKKSLYFHRDQPVGFFQGQWLTWMLIAACYGTWVALTLFWRDIPTAILVIAGGYCLALFSSVQHEAVHGHPTRCRNLNLALVRAPLTIWLPVELYERSHKAHHLSELTHPEDDPESWYVSETRWQLMGPVAQTLSRFNNTFTGRMLIGPWLTVWQCWGSEIRAIRRGDRRNLPIWIAHLAGVALVIAWVTLVAGMPIYFYLLLFVWPGISLALVRSFVEHRFNENPEHRTVIVRGCPFTRLLFLNNNYHCVHHRYPKMPWYRIPACYREQKQEIHRASGGYAYPGYWTIAWRYLLRPWGAPVYPGDLTPHESN